MTAQAWGHTVEASRPAPGAAVPSPPIRFVTARDGVQLAYAVFGKGPPLVWAAHWLTHLEFAWESPVWRHTIEFFTRHFTVVRYDERGCGLSDSPMPMSIRPTTSPG